MANAQVLCDEDVISHSVAVDNCTAKTKYFILHNTLTVFQGFAASP